MNLFVWDELEKLGKRVRETATKPVTLDPRRNVSDRRASTMPVQPHEQRVKRLVFGLPRSAALARLVGIAAPDRSS